MENTANTINWLSDSTYSEWPYSSPYTGGYYTYKPKKIKKITETIEKYDKHGKLKSKKVITREEEIDDVTYDYPYTTICDGEGTDSTDNNDNITYTNHSVSVNMCNN